jgi:hypothetical protein
VKRSGAGDRTRNGTWRVRAGTSVLVVTTSTGSLSLKKWDTYDRRKD